MPRNTATGRRLGRLQGKLDDIALELSAMLTAENAYSEQDYELTHALEVLQDNLGHVASSVEEAIERVNNLGRR